MLCFFDVFLASIGCNYKVPGTCLSSMLLPLCIVAAVHHLPVHRQSVGNIFGPFGITENIQSHSETKILPKPVLEFLASVAQFITKYE